MGLGGATKRSGVAQRMGGKEGWGGASHCFDGTMLNEKKKSAG